MLTSEQFQSQLLDYLYDLLDEADAKAMREYLEAHPEAQTLAERTRHLLSAAARKEFPEVRFEPPTSGSLPRVTTTPATIAHASSSSRQPSKAASRVLTWGVAASVLLIIGVLAIPAGNHIHGYVRALDHVKQAQQKESAAKQELQVAQNTRTQDLDKARKNVEDIKTQLASLEEQREKDLEKVREDLANKSIRMEVMGPKQLVPGAPNDITVKTMNVRGEAQHSGVTLRVMDGAKALWEGSVGESLGQCTFHLPPDIPIRANSKLAIEVQAKDKAGVLQSEVTETLEWAAPRYQAHLATDKPLYKPGQTVFFRLLTLNRATLMPPDEDFHVEFKITKPGGAEIWKQSGETRLRYITNDPIGKQLLGPDHKPVRGIAAGEYTIPDTLADGGEYILTVHDLNGRFPDEQRKFLINTKYTPDRLLKELEWDRKSYGPGAEVTAICKVMTGQDRPLAHSRVISALANVDGQEIKVPPDALGETDSNGCVKVKFKLPPKEKMDKGNGTLTVVFNDGGAQEAIQNPIPISLNKLFFEYYPEGGYLVAGVPNRVYYQVHDTRNKPAEMKGHIVDSKGQTVASTETLHDDKEPGANQGMGSFRFTPKAGETYKLVVEEPAGAEAIGKWPEIQAEGVAMFVPTGVTTGGEPIHVELFDTKSRQMLVGAYCRGRLLDHQRVQTEAGKPVAVALKPDSDLGGVVRVTIFEEEAGPANRKNLTPRAERLVYRRSARKLDFQTQADKSRYAPGSPVTLNITATNEKGEPAPAVIMAAITNESVLKMADEKTERSLVTHFEIDGEVRRPEDLEHADFLLNDQNPKAATALDLLLGVQGWRRFAEQKKPGTAPQQNLELADQLAVITGQTSRQAIDTRVQREQEVQEKSFKKWKELYGDLETAVATRIEVQNDPKYGQTELTRKQEIDQAAIEYQNAVAALQPYETVNQQLRQIGLPILGFSFLLVAVFCVARAAVRTVQKAIPYYLTAAASIAGGVLLLVILASGETKESKMAQASRDTGDAMAPAAKGGGAMPFNEQLKLAEKQRKLGAVPAIDDQNRPLPMEGPPPLPAPAGKGGFGGGGPGLDGMPGRPGGGFPGPEGAFPPAQLGAGGMPPMAPPATKPGAAGDMPKGAGRPRGFPAELGMKPKMEKAAAPVDPNAAFGMNAKEAKKGDALQRGGDADKNGKLQEKGNAIKEM